MTDLNRQSALEVANDIGDSETTSIGLEIGISGQKVQFTVTLPSGPATWEHLLPFMRALVKVGSEISQEHFSAQGQATSCRGGCAMCCRHRVPIAEFEAHRLRRLVESMPEPRRTEIIARFQAVEERIAAVGVAVSLDSNEPMSREEMTRRAGNYFRLMIACPFLENESCSIYDERPLKCREHLVTSPAENCSDPDQLPVVGLPLPLGVYLTTLFLDEDSSRPGIHWVPLNQLISWTDAHAQEPPTRTGPELLHEFMSKLSQPRH